jgi:hypothetical protein
MPDGVPDFAGLTPLQARLSYGRGPGTEHDAEIQAGQGADRVEAGD